MKRNNEREGETMYQIKYTGGYEIQVISDRHCRVSDRHNNIVFEGTYDQCHQWLTDRTCRRIG